MKDKIVHTRKFIYKDPAFLDSIKYAVDIYTYYGNSKETKDVNLEINLSDGKDNYYSLFVDRNSCKSVASALAPVNEMISTLSKAAIEFAKACNTVDSQVKKEEQVKPKVSTKKKAKSEATKQK